MRLFNSICLAALTWVSIYAMTLAQEKNLNDISNRLVVPEVNAQPPAAGTRVWQKLDAYRGWSVAHAIYLPSDWQAGQKYAVIFEYPGNGGFKNALGDASDGTIEGCRMGYGLSEGQRAIWVCLPFVDRQNRRHALNWWGDADETARYCKMAVDEVCQHWGGDRSRLLLCGFSRGALATSYIGLRDDEIAGLWCGLMAHSHYDGVRRWSYSDSDEESAIKRLLRFKSRPQWISHELTTEKTEHFLQAAGLMHDRIRLVSLPYPNHSADWLLKDTSEAQAARQWWRELMQLDK